MSNDDSKMKVVADWAFRILSALIIPLVGYVFTIQAEIAGLHGQIEVQNERVVRLQGDVSELKVKGKEIEANKLVLVRLEAELKNANGKLDDIKDALRSLGND